MKAKSWHGIAVLRYVCITYLTATATAIHMPAIILHKIKQIASSINDVRAIPFDILRWGTGNKKQKCMGGGLLQKKKNKMHVIKSVKK